MSKEEGLSLPRVILIGGAPLAGKTTAALCLAARLGRAGLSTDDLGAALRAVVTPASHPGLHPMAGEEYREYYLRHSVEELVANAEREHRAMWPAVAAVVREHATWRAPAVIEGWALRPAWVAQLDLPQTASVWLVVDEPELRGRLREDAGFLRGASDEAKLVEHFVARSVWYNRMVIETATQAGLPVVRPAPGASPDEVCELCLRHLLPNSL